ncbi:Vacuolar protease A [Mortierella sp. AD031]|nr:Vacuolar protease A [Mortierella sp. AD031]
MKPSILVAGLLSMTVASQARMMRFNMESIQNHVADSPRSLSSQMLSDSAQLLFSGQQHRGSHTIPLKDLYVHVAVIELGNPGQSLRVRLDLASANFFVTSSECKQYTCYLDRRYNATQSRTHQPVGKFFQIRDFAYGIISRDTLYLEGLEVRDQEFGEALSYMFVSPGPFGYDGILGLAFGDEDKPEDTITGRVPVLRNLRWSSQLDAPVFGLYLAQHRDNAPPGEFTIGGLERRRYRGELAWHNVVTPGQWVIALEGVSFALGRRRTHEISFKDTTRALVYPDHPYMHFDKETTQAINARLGAVPSKDRRFYEVPCENVSGFEDIAITIGSTAYWFEPNEYTTVSNNDPKMCITAFAEVDWMSDPVEERGYDAVLGAVFLRKYFSAYNFGRHRVGFALAN